MSPKGEHILRSLENMQMSVCNPVYCYKQNKRSKRQLYTIYIYYTVLYMYMYTVAVTSTCIYALPNP